MQCGKQIRSVEQEYCYDCMHTHHYYERGLSLWNHKNPVNQSVYQFKYHNQRRYGILYSQELVKEFQKEIERWRPDIIMPVPLHPSRKRKRGYNQAELLAKQLSECMGIPMEKDVLYRIKKTRPLKEMNGEQRHRNLKGAFAVSKSWNPRQNILLIDDIYTTGSTIERAAGILKKAGVENVYFLTLSIGQGI